MPDLRPEDTKIDRAYVRNRSRHFGPKPSSHNSCRHICHQHQQALSIRPAQSIRKSRECQKKPPKTFSSVSLHKKKTSLPQSPQEPSLLQFGVIMIMKTTNAVFAVSSNMVVSATATLLLLSSWLFVATDAQCIADEKIDAEFRTLLGVDAIPKANSCCQADVCGIPCPAEISDPKIGTFLDTRFLSIDPSTPCLAFVAAAAAPPSLLCGWSWKLPDFFFR
jgi:hypothetical protein